MRRWLAMLAMLAILVGCGGAQSSVQTQTVDGLTITLEAPAGPQINQSQTWTIDVRRNDAPVDASDVYLELVMPSMDMGQNNPLATRTAPGTYTASGTYTMSGTWHVTVHVGLDGKDYVAPFEIPVQD